MAEDGDGEGSSSGAGGDKGGEKKEEGGKHKKLLRLLTVMAYLSTVSGTAFMLSLYYLFLWTPKVQLGGKALVQDPPPPGTMALFFPEMAPQLAARVAEHEGATSEPKWAARTQDGRSPQLSKKGKAPGEASESQVPATPQLVLPTMKEQPEAFAAKRREARSTLMEMTTSTQQTPPATTKSTVGTRGPAAIPRPPPTASNAPPPHLIPPTHRAAKGTAEQQAWHSTPHPGEIAVHA